MTANDERDVEAIKQLRDYVSEVNERLTLKSTLLERNSASTGKWPDESFFVKKDSSLKKNTAFIKKVKNFLDSQKDVILSEFDSLNLSKYVEEVATAILDAKIKITDIPFILKLCSAMYQRYSEFGPLFLDTWKKNLGSPINNKETNISKLRVDLTLFADLNTIGIFREPESLRLLAGQLSVLVNGDMEKFTNIGIICSFCKHCGDDWIGLIPRRIRLLSEKYGEPVPRSSFISAELRSKCGTLFNNYLTNAKRHLDKMVKKTKGLLSSNQRQMENRGEVSQVLQDRAEQLVSQCRKFHESLCTLSDLLDEDSPPDFPSMLKEELKTEDMETNATVADEADTGMELFEDEDTRLFYESLQDIKAMVPGILYKDSEQAKSDANASKTEEFEADANEDIDIETLESELAKEEALLKSAEDSQGTNSTSLDKDKAPLPPVDEGDDDTAPSGKLLMGTFLTQLPTCVNRDLIDNAALDFCVNLNRKPNRRSLVRALVMVPRTRCDLLPFYARFVATLAPVMPDLAQDINSMLTGQFRWWVAKHNQSNLESKLKIVRFIGELVKFRIYPPHQALSCLKLLLPRFVDHNIEMACALLDTCGRFLYRLPETQKRTKAYLEIMMRKKTVFHLDHQYAIMIENTYYYCNPPTTKRQALDVNLTPTMKFLQHLLHKTLDRNTVNNILRLFRKIDWNDSELISFISNLFIRPWELRFTTINCLASVLSGLAVYHRDFATAVVDDVIEDIRAGMELNLPQMYQRRIIMVNYFGLLYNYCLIDSPVVFKMLYSLLTFGVSLDPTFISPLDPPDSLFRITLICTLLETSGSFFNRGVKRRKLNVFFIYFQRYYWFKRSLPIWIPPSPPPPRHSKSKNPNHHDHRTSSTTEPEPSNKDPKQATTTEPNPSQAGDTTTSTNGENQPPAVPPIPLFIPIPFPNHIEQHYFETLRNLGLDEFQARSFAEAQRLVNRIESRYRNRLGNIFQDGSANAKLSDDNKGQKEVETRSTRPTGPRQMPPILEETELGEAVDDIPLDETDVVDDEEDENEDDDVDFGGEGDDEDGHPRRRIRDDRRRGTDGTQKQQQLASSEDQKRENQDTADTYETPTTERTDSPANEKSDENDEDDELAMKMDLEFQEALDRMIAESRSSAVLTSNASSNLNSDSPAGNSRVAGVSTLPPPGVLIGGLKTRPQGTTQNSNASTNKTPDHQSNIASTLQAKLGGQQREPVSEPSPSPMAQNTVPFTLVTRRGNKPHLIPLDVPETVQFAARYIQAEAAEREEKARMKRLVLEMHQAQKEEELEWTHMGNPDAALAQQFPLNVNRNLWVRQTHPKGAPDADLVFGTSSGQRR